MSEKIHIFLVGNKLAACQKFVNAFLRSKIDYTWLDVPAVNLKRKGIYVLLPGTRHSKSLQEVLGITIQSDGYIIFYNDPIFSKLLRISLFRLPSTITHEVISAVIKSFYNLCSELTVTKKDIIRLMYPNFSLVEKTELLKQEKENLTKHTVELTTAMNELSYRNKKFTEELTLASELQKSFLPKEYPADLPLDFAHKYMPCEYIGGDLFEIIRLDQHKLGIIIADVSGHGVAAALLTAMFKSAFHHFAEGCFSPETTLYNIHKEFLETIHTEHYITAFYTVIDTESMMCKFCSAGHPKQILQRKQGDVVELSTTGFFIGIFEDTKFEVEEVELYPGDRFFFYTDGIIECLNEYGKKFGKENLLRVIGQGVDNDIAMVSNNIISELMNYTAELRFSDDITLLITEIIESI
jgi:serine phosphatase RsbU (regulator of sigma subunit)